VTPQPVDTTGLPSLGAEWKTANPYAGDKKAIEIGASGYLQNCARCHGLEMESGGMAPDLHSFPKGKEGDEIYVDLVRNGKMQNGASKMPAFFPIVSQEGLWAIRAYIESNHTD
jgi:cytochrome c-550 PedF